MNTDTSTVLTTLLDRAQAYAPEYHGSLSNHLPMALVALHWLGADVARMETFFTINSAKLDPAPPTAAACENWPTKRGDLAAFAALRAYFARAIAMHGRDSTLRQTLPLLLDGVGAAAFHGLLRTAHAVVAEHDDELASGLAHWACWHMPLEPWVAQQSIDGADTSTWLADIAEKARGWCSEAGLIAWRMIAFAQTPAFRDGADRLAVHHGTLRELATEALSIYLRSNNFTVLHLITSAHALRLLMPWLDEPLVAVRHYARAYAAGVAASGVNMAAPLIDVTVLPWPQAVQAGAASDDEHVIKLVFACHAEWRATGNAAYQRAASLAVCR
jgi:hypothetical protein